MTTDQVNYLNIGLMGVSLILAFILPFELFLFSYAFLGPLHYLTEISWLHDRQYFSPKKWDYIPLVVISFVLLASSTTLFGPEWIETLNGIQLTTDMGLGDFLVQYNPGIIFLAFGLALLFILTQSFWLRTYGAVGLLLATFAFGSGEGMKLVFGVYTPTLIHVYLFTGAFIWFGSLKSRSTSGHLSFIVFLICPFICIFGPMLVDYNPSTWALNNYPDTFGVLNYYAIKNLGWVDWQGYDPNWIFNSQASLAITRFIAFAYTYHYLNWFSKTSVIKWHEVPKLRFAAVIALWVASVGLYLYDYTVGFGWLFLLSFMHVLLEFPLNHQSFIGIGRELRKRFSGAPAKAS